jgi:Tol biopolymer transport system component
MPRDGHCSYSPDAERRWILNDTYPDAEQKRGVYLYDTQSGRRTDLGRFYSPPELKDDYRVDLHPRWSRDGGAVCFDSAHKGSRQLYVMDVTAVVASTAAS